MVGFPDLWEMEIKKDLAIDMEMLVHNRLMHECKHIYTHIHALTAHLSFEQKLQRPNCTTDELQSVNAKEISRGGATQCSGLTNLISM